MGEPSLELDDDVLAWLTGGMQTTPLRKAPPPPLAQAHYARDPVPLATGVGERLAASREDATPEEALAVDTEALAVLEAAVERVMLAQGFAAMREHVQRAMQAVAVRYRGRCANEGWIV